MEILIKPIITEKMTTISEKLNSYGFVVKGDANKVEIKNAVEKKYGVSVESVNTINYKGKIKSRYTKSGLVVGRKGNMKKAIVTLTDGDTIDFYGNI